MKSYWAALLDLGSGRVASAILVALGVAFLEGAGLLMLAPLLAASGAGAVPRWLPFPMELPAVLALWVAIVALHAGVSALRDSLIFRLQQDFADRRRVVLMSAVLALEWRAFVQERASDLTTQLTASTLRLQNGTGALLQAVTRALLLVAHAIVALLILPGAGALALAAALGLGLLRGRSLRRAVGQGRRLEAWARLLQGLAEEQLASMKLTKAWGMARAATERFRDSLARQGEERWRGYRKHIAETAQSRVISTVCAAVGVWAAVGWLGLSGAPLLVLAAVFARLLPSAGEVVRLAAQAAEALPAWTEGEALLHRFRLGAEPEEEARAEPLSGDIVLSDVVFAWPGQATAVLNGVSAVIPEGEITALTGPSGAGKSTLADIAIGLLAPESGMVMIGGVALAGAGRSAWRRCSAYVPQETFLFHASVADNLRWSAPEAPEPALWAALVAAQADELVRRLPQGLDTVLGDRGMRLSGGERQRIALARALLREPLFLVLDEATSALDDESEGKILTALESLRGKLTILVIAHRLSTVRIADRVLALEGGRLIDRGPPAS